MNIEDYNKCSLKKFLQVSGSCILISMACLDPGNLEGNMELSYKLKYKSIWVIILSHFILYFYQECALTIGVITNMDLATLTRLMYSKKMTYLLWICIEFALIAADIQEIMGASIALKEIFHLDTYLSIILVILFAILILFLQEFGQNIFEYTFFGLLLIMAITFGYNFFLTPINYTEFLKGFIITIPNNSTRTIISVIGAIIMPQNLYLQSGLVLTRKNIDFTKKLKIKIFKIETFLIIVCSVIINIFICGVFLQSDKIITLGTANNFLKSLPINLSLMWNLGLLSSGLSSTTSGALTGQYVINGYLNFNLSKTLRNLISRGIILIPCLLIITYYDISSIMTFLNIIQFIQLPFAVIPMIQIVKNKILMKNYEYSKNKINFIIFLTIVLQVFNMFLIYDLLKNNSFIKNIYYIIGIIFYYYILVYLIFFKTDFYQKIDVDNIEVN